MIKHLTICIFVFLFSMKSIFGQQAALVEVDKVKLDTPNQEVPIIGSLRSKKITNIMAPVAGKVDNVYVEEGDTVKKGQLLAQIDNKNYKYLLDIAISNEIKASSNYEIAKLETFNNKLDLDRMLALKNSSAFNQSKYDKLNTLNDILKSKEKVVSGLIFDPIKDEMFFAEKNKGAYLNNHRMRVSNKNSIEDCLFSSNHEGVKFSNLNMRYSGCATLDLAYVACGRLDGYFHNKINIWDIAAGALMVEEAGGIVNDLSKFNINNIDIRASSGAINDKMLENLKNF